MKILSQSFPKFLINRKLKEKEILLDFFDILVDNV
jgi:hypothetical protein